MCDFILKLRVLLLATGVTLHLLCGSISYASTTISISRSNHEDGEMLQISSANQRAKNDMQIRRLRKLLTTRGVNTDQVFEQLRTIIHQEARAR